MNKKSQFLDLIQSNIEDETLRNKLIDAGNNVFRALEDLKDDAIETRDKAKGKLRDKVALLDSIQDKLGLDEDFTVTDIASKIKTSATNDEIEAKYKTDIDGLRAKLSESEASYNDLQTKFDDTMFTNSINQSGVLSNFVDEPMARNNILSQYKEKTIYEDGKLYAKDETTGKIATDLTTGAKLGIESVTANIVKGLNPMYLNPQVKGTNGGANSTQQTHSTNTNKRSEMTASQKAEYITKNGQEAYLKLDN